MILRPYQSAGVDATLEAFKTHRAVLGVAATGMGKCLGRGTPVLLHDGNVVPVEEIVVDDWIMGPDSKPRRVTSCCSGTEAMYRIIPTKGESFTCNESHILSLKRTRRRNGDRLAGEIVNISVGDYLKQNKNFKHLHKLWRVGVDFAEHKRTPLIDPYFIGLWLGDGNSRRATITTGDKEVIEYIERFAASINMVTRIEWNSPGSFNVRVMGRRRTGVGGTPLMNMLRHYRLILNKHIPNRYKTGSRAERLALLAGLIDSDGHYSGGCYNVILKSERLLRDMAFVARSLGLGCTIKSAIKTCTNNGATGNYWRCVIFGDISEIPCIVRRKQAKARKQKKSPLVTGFKIEPLGAGEYFGFEIAGSDRLFLLGDFTVTHNTVMFAHIAERIHAMTGKRTLVLAHTAELVYQAAHKIEAVTGMKPEIEMADARADAHFFRRSPIVVGTVQTQIAGKNGGRMKRFNPKEFASLVFDEAHRSVAETYLRIAGYYREGSPEIRIFGTTATPDRTDSKGLVALFDHVSFCYDILYGINEGWLTPIHQKSIVIKDLDFSKVKSTAGDLNGADLAAVMEEESHLHEVASATIAERGDRKTLVFAASVRHAELLSNIFNRHRPGSSRWVSGKTPRENRAEIIRDFAANRFGVLVNVGVLIEGFDDPGIELVVVARPTESRARYAQMIGRGTRPLPGVVDEFPDSPARRLAAIAKSAKPMLEVLDFDGNAGTHKLVTAADILGTNASQEEIARAKIKSRGTSMDPIRALGIAREELIREAQERHHREMERRKHVIASVRYSTRHVDPFNTFDIRPKTKKSYARVPDATPGQIMQLERYGIPTKGLNRADAHDLLDEAFRRQSEGKANYQQIRFLAAHGVDAKDMTFDAARAEISRVRRDGRAVVT